MLCLQSRSWLELELGACEDRPDRPRVIPSARETMPHAANRVSCFGFHNQQTGWIVSQRTELGGAHGLRRVIELQDPSRAPHCPSFFTKRCSTHRTSLSCVFKTSSIAASACFCLPRRYAQQHRSLERYTPFRCRTEGPHGGSAEVDDV